MSQGPSRQPSPRQGESLHFTPGPREAATPSESTAVTTVGPLASLHTPQHPKFDWETHHHPEACGQTNTSEDTGEQIKIRRMSRMVTQRKEVMAELQTTNLAILIFLTITRPSPNPKSMDTFQKTQVSREDWLFADKKQGGLSPEITVTPHPGLSLSN